MSKSDSKAFGDYFLVSRRQKSALSVGKKTAAQKNGFDAE
jgi:hypothetical protein